ncbi:dodecin domain-containing protein [Alkalicella caledoniensis]|uniref:Dodecin domain-containing protein n=1 Tax=Alkalicella caledoniensis TaxID=2731377 RepID=A0A7G9WBZ4_ALKCA|nr:dodecin family protein [Alkalicella caledoniensis]QNO16206.1 dodecin domain-containing protein [Alkalicella caledoniensis]
MSVVKVIELVGDSNQSWEDAASKAISRAQDSVDGITGVEIKRMTAVVQDGKIVEYKTNLDVAFEVK